uniref:F-box protein CPR1-like n=1 Tax=Erigeron canadensis TaxID=72917 RepID=UPI001CB88CAE|nr:F-box protein CPR1-like [Erigeron canadensis]
MAADDKISDLILDNILARLDAKSLLRCRRVSKHWNNLIKDPYFMMKSRARRMIYVIDCKLLNLVDDNNPAHNSMLNLCSPYQYWGITKLYHEVRVLGTINGIVLLQYYDSVGASSRLPPPYCEGDLMLCNPLTREYKLLPTNSNCGWCKRSIYWDDFSPFPHYTNYAYGFGFGSATPDDLKIVRFREYNERHGGVCEIFSLKTFTWSKPVVQDMINIKDIEFENAVGTFLNGFLYWIRNNMDKLIVLDVGKMVLSEIHLPFQRSYIGHRLYAVRSCLGTIHGCLCLLNRSINYIECNLWVMNNEQGDQNSWSLRCTFDVGYHHFVCILDSGRIVMSCGKKLHIYDTSENLYTLTDVSINPGQAIHGIEYLETLVSLSDVCSAD